MSSVPSEKEIVVQEMYEMGLGKGRERICLLKLETRKPTHQAL